MSYKPPPASLKAGLYRIAWSEKFVFIELNDRLLDIKLKGSLNLSIIERS